MEDKLNREYFEAGATAFNYNNVTGGADSASGGSGGSGMECLQLRSQPFHYLISEQAKSLVALQELQNEVGALLEFRDLVIETFPNLRSKMAPSTPASGTRRDWEPGVRVRRKLAAGDRAKPQPSVQDSGFSTETSCKDAHSAARSRPADDELCALLDVIQRKGVRLKEEVELLRGEHEHRATAEESFARALEHDDNTEVQRLRDERDALLVRTAALEAASATSPAVMSRTGSRLGRLDGRITPGRSARVPAPDSDKFAAILLESNPVELQRQLLNSTIHNQVLSERLSRVSAQRADLMEKLERARDLNEDLKFRLEEKNIEVEGARALARQLERGRGNSHSSMREMEPLALPEEARRRPSRIPLSRPPAPRAPPRPPSAHSARSARSTSSAKSAVPVRRSPDTKKCGQSQDNTDSEVYRESMTKVALVAEYVSRTARLAPLFPRLHTVRARPLPADLLLDYRLAYETPQNLALELSKSILYENADSIEGKIKSIESHPQDSLWNGKPQQYFESMNYSECGQSVDEAERDYDTDSLAP